MKKLEDLQSNAAKEKEEFCQNVTKEIENLEKKLVETENLEKQIADLKSSHEFITENDILEAKQRIVEAKQQISKAQQINRRISTLENSPLLQALAKNETKSKIEKARDVLRKLGSQTQDNSNETLNAVLQAQQDARRELECVICLDVPSVDTQVFSCLEQHLMCARCCKHNLRSCPVCRQSFEQTPPARNRLAEKMISRLQ